MIQLNTETHKYTKDGVPIPGVSRVLREAGLVDFSAVPKDILERASRFGDAVHRTTELYDHDNLNEDALDPALKAYLDAWKKFLKDTGFEIEAIEEVVESKKYYYCGRLDRRGILHIKKGDVLYAKRVALDVKATASIDSTTAIQLAAYKNAYNEGKKAKDKIRDRAVVQLKGDGTYAMPGKDFFQKSDFSVFLAALTLRNWRLKNGKHNRS